MVYSAVKTDLPSYIFLIFLFFLFFVTHMFQIIKQIFTNGDNLNDYKVNIQINYFVRGK